MHTNWCVLIEISMEIVMWNFWNVINGHCTDKKISLYGVGGGVKKRQLLLIFSTKTCLRRREGGQKSWKCAYVIYEWSPIHIERWPKTVLTHIFWPTLGAIFRSKNKSHAIWCAGTTLMGKLVCNTDCEAKEVAGGTLTKILIFCMLITLGPKLIS